MTELKNKRNYNGSGYYIGRPSDFGNPVRVGYKCQECGVTHMSRGSTLICYEKYLWRRLGEDEFFYKRLKDLMVKAKTIICWCHPSPCHGHILIKWKENGFPRYKEEISL